MTPQLPAFAGRVSIPRLSGRSAFPQLRRSATLMAPIIIAALSLIPVVAEAQTISGGASPATMINNVCTFILGPFGQSLAVLGIIGIGLSWMFGRISLGLIAGVIGGIVIMFGASYLGSTLTGGGGG